MFSLTGKTAIVTGASKGIGRAIALAMGHAGARVVPWARNMDQLEWLAAEIRQAGGQAQPMRVDITDSAAIEAAIDKTIDAFGRIDCLVCNAGAQNIKPFLDMSETDWGDLIRTNLDGAIRTIQAVGRRMVAQRSGSIIAMGSIYGFVGATGASVYALTKGGLIQLTKALAVEWARNNVRVNAICPGWIETDMTTPYMQDEKIVKAALKQIPLGRFGKPEDIAPVAIYLAADESSFVTGQTFVIDGGQIAR